MLSIDHSYAILDGMSNSLFITIEGIEGAGKSVQVGLLASRLRELGRDIVVTREPGGTRIGEEVRKITHDPQNVDLTAVAEAYLMAASRAQHLREVIKPALDMGKIVICDRFLDSSIVYQGFGRELGENVVAQLNSLAVEGTLPNVTILLDIPVDVGITRRNGTNKVDRLDLQQKDFYERVRNGYLTLAKKDPQRIKSIDGTKSIEEVAKMIWQIVEPLLKVRP